ncbi:hypothetical protein ACET3Z_000396 [Daucus carota]
MSSTAPQPYMPVLCPNIGMHKVPSPTISQGFYLLPLPEEANPPLPKEPKPKRQRLDDSLLFPEDQFLAQHQGLAHINFERKNCVGNQLPSDKQKLSGEAGFLKDNLRLPITMSPEGQHLPLL